MKTYKITEQRDGAIAATTIKSNMTLKKAQIELLKMAIWDTQKGFTNWGLMVAYANKTRSPFHASPTASDGTRCYTYGVYKYKIEEED